MLKEALDQLDPETQPNELAMALTSLGRYHHARSEYSEAIALHERARVLAEPLDDSVTLTYIYAYLSGAHEHLARFDEAAYWANRCLALGERHQDPGALAVGHEFLAEIYWMMGHWELSLQHANREVEIAEKYGFLSRLSWALLSRGAALNGLGRLADGREALEEVLVLADQVTDQRVDVLGRCFLSLCHTDLGNSDLAISYGQEAIDGSEPIEEFYMLGFAQLALAYAFLQAGEIARARAIYERNESLLRSTENYDILIFQGAYHAEAMLRMDDFTAAAGLIGDNIERAASAGAVHSLGVYKRVEGQLLAARGDHLEAEAALDEALAKLEELGSRVEIGRTLLQRGLLSQAQGRTEKAHLDFQAAVRQFEDCGAALDLQKALAISQQAPD